MQRVGRPGRRTWVYVGPGMSCCIWGKPAPFGRWDPWAVAGTVSASGMTAYRKLAKGDQLGRDRQRAETVARLIGSDPIVYAFYAPESSLIKIGRTSNLRQRWGKLENESGSPRQLLSVWVCPQAPMMEHDLHRRWLEHRRWGEWFAADPVLADLRSLFTGQA